MKLLRHVDGRTLADIQYIPQQLLELGVDDRSVDRQVTRGDLGRESLAGAGKTVAEGRRYGEGRVSLTTKGL